MTQHLGISRDAGPCLADEIVAGLSRGSLSTAQRNGAIAHIAGCAECRIRVAGAAELFRDSGVAAAIAAASSGPGSRKLRLRHSAWIPAAVAAALLIVAIGIGQFRANNGGADILRDGALATEAAPSFVSPVGNVADARTFVWTRPAGYEYFRMTLFDFEGVVLWEGTLRDTSLAIPDTVRFTPGTRYYWKVDAYREYGRYNSSGLREFRIADSVRRGGR